MTGQLDPGSEQHRRLRISDAERARAAGELDAAVADGRLTWTEHSERSGLVWAAQTRADLAPPLADLGASIDVETPQVQRVVATFSKVGRAISASTRQVYANAVFGAIVLDLSAMRPGQEIFVQASSFCGKVLVLVADNATVVDEGDVLLGKRAALRTSPPPGGPLVRLAGRSAFGNLKVRRASEGLFGHRPEVFAQLRHLTGAGEQHVHLHQDRHVHLHGRHHDRHYDRHSDRHDRRRHRRDAWGDGNLRRHRSWDDQGYW